MRRLFESLAAGVMSSALLLGCGGNSGGSGSAPPPADFSASTPTTLPSSSLTQIEISTSSTTSASALTMAADPCHPRLFERTSEVADVLNNHTHKMMDRIASIIRHPKARDNSPNCTVDNKSDPTAISCTIDPAAGLFEGYPLTLTWQKSALSGGGEQYVTNVYVQPSSTSAADLHQCELGAAPTLPAACTQFFSSTLDVTTNANGYDVSSPAGTPVIFDFTALHSVDSTELATGKFAVNVDFAKDTTKPNPFRRVLGFTFIDFVPALTAAEIAAGDANHGARSGQLSHVGYTGSANGGGGGAMEFVDEVILFCPQYSSEPNPPTLYSDALTVGRWYRDTTTSPVTLYGRVDAEAVGDSGGTTPTGGGGGNSQLPSGTDYVGAVCYSATVDASGNTTASTTDAWMFAEQTSSGVTANSYVCGPEATAGNTSTCTSACSSKFGSLPTVSGTTMIGGYGFNGLSPSIGSSGIPTDPASIVTGLAPLLCGTGIGTAWTGQPNCP